MSFTDARMVTVRSIATVNLMAGESKPQLGQHAPEPIHRIDDVGTGLTEDDHKDAGLSVGQSHATAVFHRIRSRRQHLQHEPLRHCDKRPPAAGIHRP